MNFGRTLVNSEQPSSWYSINVIFVPFMIYSNQLSNPSDPLPCTTTLRSLSFCPLYAHVCSFLLRSALFSTISCPLFLLPPEDPHQGKPINSIPLLFMSQTFTRPRLSKSWLMSSVAFSDLSCEQDPKTQSTLCMTTNTISQRVAMLSQLSAVLSSLWSSDQISRSVVSDSL